MASPPGPPTYGGPMYYPQPIEGMLTRRNVFALNALGLIGIYLGILFRLATSDLNVRGLAHFLVISGGMLGALASLAGGLGSKRTSDLQNIGLLVWAGLLLTFTFTAFVWILTGSIEGPDRRVGLGGDGHACEWRLDGVRGSDVGAGFQVRVGVAINEAVEAVGADGTAS